jgi:hypothetical protein
MAEITVKGLLCCGFRRTGKSDGTSVSMLVEDMLKYVFSSDSNSQVLRFTSICVLFTDSPLY